MTLGYLDIKKMGKKIEPKLRMIVLNHNSEVHRERYKHVHDAINLRALWEEYRELGPDYRVWFVNWGRDCDMAEWRSEPRQRDASHLMELYVRVLDACRIASEEGPGGEYAVHPDTLRYHEKRAFHSDRALEAFEEGHAHFITSLL